MLVGLHTTWYAPQAKNPSYAPVHYIHEVERGVTFLAQPIDVTNE